MEVKSRNGIALAMLLFGKVAGIIGLIVGITQYRVLGAVLLGLDGAFLVGAVAIALSNMRAIAREETDQKKILEQMVREGTLDQYLRDLKASGKMPAKGSGGMKAAAESDDAKSKSLEAAN